MAAFFGWIVKEIIGSIGIEIPTKVMEKTHKASKLPMPVFIIVIIACFLLFYFVIVFFFKSVYG
jgi:hypothetical protein